MSPRFHDIDPCTDFDKLVCEGWAEKHDLRADQGGSFTGTIMAENSQQILRHVLESPYPIDNQNIEVHSVAKQEIFKKLHDAYEACMSEEIIREAGSTPLLSVLRKIEELFPAARPHEGSDSFSAPLDSVQKGLLLKHENNLSKTITYLTSIGVGALVTFNVAVCVTKYTPYLIFC
jgi:endothelin-converting enzyme